MREILSLAAERPVSRFHDQKGPNSLERRGIPTSSLGALAYQIVGRGPVQHGCGARAAYCTGRSLSLSLEATFGATPQPPPFVQALGCPQGIVG